MSVFSIFLFVTIFTILLCRFPNLRGKNRRWCALGVCLTMYLLGLSMVTNGGIYILQLVNIIIVITMIVMITIVRMIMIVTTILTITTTPTTLLFQSTSG